MNLSSEQRRIIASTLPDSWRTTAEVAKELRLRPHTVHYALTRLKEEGVIEPFLLINPHLLGLTDYCIFVNLTSGGGATVRTAFIEFCKSAPRVAYLAEHTGIFQFSISLFANNVFDVERFFSDLYERFPKITLDKRVAVRSRWIIFERRYLSEQRDTAGMKSKIVYAREEPTQSVSINLDAVDQKLLRALSIAPSKSVLQLAKRTEIAESTARSRIQALQKSGLLIGVPFWLHANKIGRNAYRLLIDCGGFSKKLEPTLFEFARSSSSVTQLVRCFGGWDFELSLECASPEEVNIISDGLNATFEGAIRSIRTISEVKIHSLNQFPNLLMT